MNIRGVKKLPFPLRVALFGALGSGCTTTMLRWAHAWSAKVLIIDWNREVDVQFPGEDYCVPSTCDIAEATRLLREAAGLDHGAVRSTKFYEWAGLTPRYDALIDAVKETPLHVILNVREKSGIAGPP